MKPCPSKEQIIMIVLSAIDLVAGVLSIVFSQIAVQVIAALASGATLIKAIRIAKATQLAKAIKIEETAIKVAVKAIPAVAAIVAKKCVHKNYKKETITMKELLQKLKAEVKNNPITILTTLFETACCGGGGYAIYRFLLGYSDKIPYPWNIVVTVFITLVIYLALALSTIYLGRDNKVFAAIRKLVKLVGGEQAVGALEQVEGELNALAQKEAEQQRLIEEKKARDEEIKAKILAEEKKRDEELWERKIALYLANHPEEAAKVADENINIKAAN